MSGSDENKVNGDITLPMLGVKSFVANTGLVEHWADKARHLFNMGDYDLVVIVSQLVIEVATHQAIWKEIMNLGLEEKYTKYKNKGFWLDNLTQKNTYEIYFDLFNDEIKKTDLWSDYKVHYKKRNEIAHKGDHATKDDAAYSLELSSRFRKYLEKVRRELDSTMSEFDYEGKRSWIIGIFENEIEKYLYSDLSSLSSPKLDPALGKTYGSCAVPLALLLFSFCDLFGFYTREGESVNIRETAKNIEAMFQEFFPKDYQDRSDLLIKMFRHGLMHQFIFNPIGVGKHGIDRQIVFLDSENTTVLNVDKFLKDFRSMLESFKEKIIRDDSFVKTVSARIDDLNKKNKEVLAGLVDQLPKAK